MDRNALITGLAESVGITEGIDPNFRGSRYNPDTGTYYCDGIPLPHGSIENIKAWYKSQMESYREQAGKGGMKREYFMRYALAYNAITFMEKSFENEKK